MTKKINTKFIKLIKYYSLINHNLIYENEAINRYKINSNLAIKGSKGVELQELKQLIDNIKNCELKRNSTNNHDFRIRVSIRKNNIGRISF